ncbi:glycosyltransferase [Consotaella aegiceratis]|uniref:glycosyltransferase n=1 Tax=Consotaella aegiceratis TaxID=3097961 RepID=UPI002F3FDCE0
MSTLNPMKICVVMPRYSIAGVPLAQMRFARALADRGHSVDLVVGRIDPDQPIPDIPAVSVIKLQTRNVRGMLIPLWRYLRAARPDVAFSAEDHLTIILLAACILSRSTAKVSGSSRILPTDRQAYSSRWFSKGWWLKQTMKMVMWRANALTCVSRDMVGMYQQVFRNAPHTWVYNIIKDERSAQRASENVDHRWLKSKEEPLIVSAGTLTKRKGFVDLIRAFSIARQTRNCHLLILGEGYLRRELEQLAEDLGISEYVEMPGNVDNPLKYFSRSDVFVLASYAEGLPNVLVEAMMSGCTPVATDCPTGPREVLQDGKYGYLVPMRDPVAMAAAIEHALDHPIPKPLLDEAVAPFEEEAVIRRHFEVLGLSSDAVGVCS